MRCRKQKDHIRKENLNRLKKFSSIITSNLDMEFAYIDSFHREQERYEEVSSAKKIQKEVLSQPIDNGNISICAIYEPSSELSGDIYSWHEIKPNEYSIFLVDVMGHGLGVCRGEVKKLSRSFR